MSFPRQTIPFHTRAFVWSSWDLSVLVVMDRTVAPSTPQGPLDPFPNSKIGALTILAKTSTVSREHRRHVDGRRLGNLCPSLVFSGVLLCCCWLHWPCSLLLSSCSRWSLSASSLNCLGAASTGGVSSASGACLAVLAALTCFLACSGLYAGVNPERNVLVGLLVFSVGLAVSLSFLGAFSWTLGSFAEPCVCQRGERALWVVSHCLGMQSTLARRIQPDSGDGSFRRAWSPSDNA